MASTSSPLPSVDDVSVVHSLSKWVNVAKGYSQRWFVLQNGTLTYFRHQEDEGKASRGTVSLNHTVITGPHKDGLKFEVTSDVARRNKWYLKGNREPFLPNLSLPGMLKRSQTRSKRYDGSKTSSCTLTTQRQAASQPLRRPSAGALHLVTPR